MKDSVLIELSAKYPFPYSEIKEIQQQFKLKINELESIIKLSMLGGFSLDSVSQVLKGFDGNEVVYDAYLGTPEYELNGILHRLLDYEITFDDAEKQILDLINK